MIHSILIFTLSGIPLYQKHFTSHEHHYHQSSSSTNTPKHHVASPPSSGTSSHHANATGSTSGANQASVSSSSSTTNSVSGGSSATPKVPPISMLQALISSMWRTAWNLKMLNDSDSHDDDEHVSHSMLTHMHFDYMSLTLKVNLSHELMCVLMHDHDGDATYEFCYLMAGEILREFVSVCAAGAPNHMMAGGSQQSGANRWEGFNQERMRRDDEKHSDERLQQQQQNDDEDEDDEDDDVTESGIRESSQFGREMQMKSVPEIAVSSLSGGETTFQTPQPKRATPTGSNNSTIPSGTTSSSPLATSIKSITSEQQRIMNTRFFKICHSMRDRLIRDTLREQHGCVSCHLIDVREHHSEFSLSMSGEDSFLGGRASVSLAGSSGFSAFGGSPSFSIPSHMMHASSSFGTSDSSDSDSFDLSANLNILISHAKDVMHEIIDDPVEIHIKTSDEHIHYIAKISTHNFLVVKYQANRSQHMRRILAETVDLLRKIHGFMSSISTQSAG